MNICKNCGVEYEPGTVFCRNCGMKVEPYEEPKSQPEPQPAPQPETPVTPPYTPPVPPASSTGAGKGNPNTPIIFTMIAIAAVVIVALFVLLPKYINPTSNVELTNPGDEPISSQREEMPKEPPKPKVSSYEAIKSNASWNEANNNAINQGGHLVCINNADEFNRVCSIADSKNIKVFWVGARRSPSNSWNETLWHDGERISFIKWLSGEPTNYSESGEDELYLMVFKVNGEWYFNDSVNSVSQYYSGKMGYIVEIEE